MDVNNLKINLGLLETFISRSQRHKAVTQSTLLHILNEVDSQTDELEVFLEDIKRVRADVREEFKV